MAKTPIKLRNVVNLSVGGSYINLHMTVEEAYESMRLVHMGLKDPIEVFTRADSRKGRQVVVNWALVGAVYDWGPC